MAGTSSQGLELNRSDRGPEAETSESQEALKEVNYEMVQGSFNIALPPPSDSLEPYIGMEFKSLEVARTFYEVYGIHQGFTIRNAHSRRSQKDNSIIGKDYVCSKEGFRATKYPIKERKTLQPRPVTREGCNAMFRIAKKDRGKWVVTGFVREHSHELMPHKVPPLTLQMNSFGEEDERDKKIRELSIELQQEKKLHAACKRRLDMILKYTEEHTQNISLKVDVIVNNIRELESDEQDVTPYR